MSKITGKEYPLSNIFSSEFEYYIPSYQRPYAWTTEQAEVLFDDLYQFFIDKTADNYFLGSIVLIKEEGNSKSEVIDGQQRLTTLSILFAVMAEAFDDEELKGECKSYIWEKGNIGQKIKSRPRLTLRKKDQEFFEKYIEKVALEDLMNVNPLTLDEAKKHIYENAKLLREKLDDRFSSDEERLEFYQFVLNECFLVAVSTPDQESAFRIFSVMNSRGLDLLPTDIIKSDTIGKLSKDKQDEYTDKWEEMENKVERAGFNEVCTHTRMIFAKERPRKTLLEEFREYVMERTSPEELIDDYLIPYTDIYSDLRNCNYRSSEKSDEINEVLRWLNKTYNNDWMPPAIQFLSTHQKDDAYVLWFLRKLERLAAYLLVTAQDVNARMSRYKWLLVEMERRPDTTLDSPLRMMELTEWEKKRFLDVLDGNIYDMPAKRRNYIIQRLNSLVSDGAATIDSKLFTIEHVLPQHPGKDSEWMKLWTRDEMDFWVNRMANLVPLTGKHNSAAQNYDFDTKKKKYFQSKGGTTSYPLTTQVINEEKWIPEVVKKRQEDILRIFSEKWELMPDETALQEDGIFYLAGNGSDAMGRLEETGKLVVLKGSRISSIIAPSLQENYRAIREKLIKQGVIQDNIFTCDWCAESVSQAAVILLGRSANGNTEWKKMDGRALGKCKR